jgi:chromate transporter
MAKIIEVNTNYSLSELVKYFLKLGTIGFGGPVALIGYMNRDLVEQRKWFTETEYKEGLTLAQLAPGPLAAQMSMYLGYAHYGITGASLVGLAFVLPSFLMVVILGLLYQLYGGLSWIQAIFYAVGASVIGIIAFSAYKLTKKTLAKDKLLWAIFLVTAIVTVITENEQVLLFLLSGIIAWIVKEPPEILKRKAGNINNIFLIPLAAIIPVAATPETAVSLWNIFLYFAKAGAFVFGSGLAIVPFLYGGLVKDLHWLNDKQFVDAVAVAMITPGPVVITVGFIGFLIAGFAGASTAALGTFLPCYLFTVILAPYFKKHGQKAGVSAFVNGVTASATGAITGAVIVLGKRSVFDIPTALLALVSVLLLWKVKKVTEPVIILGSAIIGLLIKFLT